MAAPPEITLRNLSGNYTMNKSLSDNQDALLTLQGIGWLTRKAVGLATVTLVIKEFEEGGDTHIDITSTASGLSTSQENRVANWQERDHEDKLFGSVKGKSRFFKKADFQSALESLTDDERSFLLAEKLKDGSPSAFLDEDLFQSVAFNQKAGWGADQVWGFEDVNGERRYTRRVLCKKGSKSERIRLVYDYNGPLN